MIYLCKTIECIAPRVKSNINYGLWVIITYQCKFISCKTCTTPVLDVGNGRDFVLVGDVGCIWEFTVLSAQFCHEPKTFLKNKV